MSRRAVLAREPGTLAQELDGEVLLLRQTAGEVLHLNPTASVVWALLATPCTLDELVATLDEAYGSPNDLRRDVSALVDDLLRHGVLIDDA